MNLPVPLPPIGEEAEWITDNPNTQELVEWVQGYATRYARACVVERTRDLQDQVDLLVGELSRLPSTGGRLNEPRRSDHPTLLRRTTSTGREDVTKTLDELMAMVEASYLGDRFAVDALKAALRELIADAQRYRWLRNVAPFWSTPTPQVMTTLFDNGRFKGYTPTQDMDAAIDATRVTAAPPLPTSEQA